MDQDVGAGIIGGILDGIGQGAKDYFTVQQKRAELQMNQDKAESDINFQKAQTDKMEADANISGIQADQMRDFIANNKKIADAQNDNSNSMLDSVEDRIHKAVSQHVDTLKSITSTPQGQDAAQSYIQQRNGQLPAQPQDVNNPSPLVNTIMPGVGANNAPTGQPPYSTSNPPPMSMIGGGTNQPAAPQTPNADTQAPATTQTTSTSQPSANGGQQESDTQSNLPPLNRVFPEASQIPFGQNAQQDWFTMSPEGKIVQKTPDMINVENPMHLSPYQKEIVNNSDQLLKAGYSKQDILKELPPDQAKQLQMVGDYKMKLSDATSAYRMSQEYKTAFQGLMGSLYPNYDENKFPERHAYMTGLASTSPNSVGGQVNSLNTLAAHLGELNNQLLVNKNGGIPAGNALINFVNQQLGHPEVNNFNAAKDIFSAEMNRLLSGKAATVSGIKEAVSNLDPNSSTNQLRGVIKTYANMASDKINSLRDQYQDTLDQPENGRILKSQARNILISIMGNDKFKAHDSGEDAINSDNVNTQFNQPLSTSGKDFSKFWG